MWLWRINKYLLPVAYEAGGNAMLLRDKCVVQTQCESHTWSYEMTNNPGKRALNGFESFLSNGISQWLW